MKGVIFDSKEFTVHDGPGIRTTVFSKGALCAACGAIIRKVFLQNRS